MHQETEQDTMEVSPLGAPPATVISILRKLQDHGFCLNLNASSSPGEGTSLCLFDQILKVFMEEVDRWGHTLPLPASLTGGGAVDLFTLYRAVGQKGGFDAVSSNKRWASVASDIGLPANSMLSLKLVYFKYLGALNPLLRSLLEEYALEVEECKAPAIHRFLAPCNGSGSSSSGGSDGDIEISDPMVYSSSKGKHNNPMLNWLLQVSKNPGAPSDDECVGEEGVGAGELASRLLMAREVMVANNVTSLKKEDGSLSADEDYIRLATNTNKRSRCSKRVHSVNNQGLWTGAVEEGKTDKRRRKSSRRKKVGIHISPLFQAYVPEWTGMDSGKCDDGSDSQKWLGTEIYSPHKQCNGGVPIGKGREDNCSCGFPGSVNCHKVHVAEKRNRLKLELASAFTDWQFERMGEDVAESWTVEEEQRFKDIVQLNHSSLHKNLWDKLNLAFPSKGRKRLVNYYFNVFLLRRRAYQNRASPDSIDSDDEDRDYDYLKMPIPLHIIKAWDGKSHFCSQDPKWVDLTDPE